MPALDKCHDSVVRALEKIGWKTDAMPFTLDLANTQLFIDIVARQVTNSEIMMVVEAKCFSRLTLQTHDLYVAIGQYLIYCNLLKDLGKSIPLYLAIPTHAYEGIFRQAAMSTLDESNIWLIVFDIATEEIIKWIK